MATPTELTELEHGNGTWENIQEVLRFGFCRLWKAFAGVDDRVTELEKVVAAQKNDSQRQHQHLEAIAQTLNTMSEQLRLQQEEAMNQQIEARLQHLECRPTEVDATSRVTFAKVERRLDLLEEEMGHIVTAIDQKADAEVMLEQGRTLQEAIRKRCNKEAFDQEVLGLQERLQLQRQALEKELKTSISDFKAVQESLLHSEIERWAGKAHELATESVRTMLDKEIQQQGEVVGAMDIQIKLCCDALEAQQKRMDDFHGEIEEQVRVTIAADREVIARQCSEAHGRIDYQFRTQEETLERIQCDLREEIATTVSTRAQQTMADIAGAIEDLDHRVLDREHQELDKIHRQLTEEVQLTVANTLKALEPAKVREQRKLKQHQHVVGRKLAELDQMMQLIGRQLIQNTSQLQVVRNEQLEYNFESEESAYDDDDLLLQYDNVAESTILAQVSQTPILPDPLHLNLGSNTDMTASIPEDTAELLARRSQHHELQAELDKKLRDYSQVLVDEKPTQSPNE